jgi:hypothetical protein
MRLSGEGGIASGDPLSGGLKTESMSVRYAHSHFVSPHPDRASSTVCSKTKCPAKGGDIDSVLRRAGYNFRTSLQGIWVG